MKRSAVSLGYLTATGCLLGLICIGGMVGSGGDARADDGETVSCEGEGMDFGDPSVTKVTCSKFDISGSVGHATLTILVAQGHGAFLVVRRFKSGYRSYFPERSVEEWLSMDHGFGRLQEVKPRPSYAGYGTASFRGSPQKDASLVLSCFAFVRNEGNPQGETDGPLGFLNVVQGSYCRGNSTDMSDAEIARVLGAIHVRLR